MDLKRILNLNYNEQCYKEYIEIIIVINGVMCYYIIVI